MSISQLFSTKGLKRAAIVTAGALAISSTAAENAEAGLVIDPEYGISGEAELTNTFSDIANGTTFGFNATTNLTGGSQSSPFQSFTVIDNGLSNLSFYNTASASNPVSVVPSSSQIQFFDFNNQLDSVKFVVNDTAALTASGAFSGSSFEPLTFELTFLADSTNRFDGLDATGILNDLATNPQNYNASLFVFDADENDVGIFNTTAQTTVAAIPEPGGHLYGFLLTGATASYLLLMNRKRGAPSPEVG